MSRPAAIDPDLLRTFVLIAEERSFTRAAELVGRTQSAVSMQMQRLEGLLGQQLFHRGRGGAVDLTRHGEFLLDRARDMLCLNDDIWRTFREPAVSGSVSLGTPDDYALSFLPRILKRFAEVHPQVEVEVVCAPSEELGQKLQSDAVDLALLTDGLQPEGMTAEPLCAGSLVWVGSARHAVHRMDPLPLAVARGPCQWARAATSRLAAAGRAYRIAYTSSTQTGTFVPVLAGLAIAVAAADMLPEGLVVLGEADGLPPLPEFQIVLAKSRNARRPVTDALSQYIAEVFNRAVRHATPPLFR